MQHEQKSQLTKIHHAIKKSAEKLNANNHPIDYPSFITTTQEKIMGQVGDLAQLREKLENLRFHLMQQTDLRKGIHWISPTQEDNKGYTDIIIRDATQVKLEDIEDENNWHDHYAEIGLNSLEAALDVLQYISKNNNLTKNILTELWSIYQHFYTLLICFDNNENMADIVGWLNDSLLEFIKEKITEDQAKKEADRIFHSISIRKILELLKTARSLSPLKHSAHDIITIEKNVAKEGEEYVWQVYSPALRIEEEKHFEKIFTSHQESKSFSKAGFLNFYKQFCPNNKRVLIPTQNYRGEFSQPRNWAWDTSGEVSITEQEEEQKKITVLAYFTAMRSGGLPSLEGPINDESTKKILEVVQKAIEKNFHQTNIHLLFQTLTTCINTHTGITQKEVAVAKQTQRAVQASKRPEFDYSNYPVNHETLFGQRISMDTLATLKLIKNYRTQLSFDNPVALFIDSALKIIDGHTTETMNFQAKTQNLYSEAKKQVNKTYPLEHLSINKNSRLFSHAVIEYIALRSNHGEESTISRYQTGQRDVDALTWRTWFEAENIPVGYMAHLAALEAILYAVQIEGDPQQAHKYIPEIACKSGKDRTGLVLMIITIMLRFFNQYHQLFPDRDNKEQIQCFKNIAKSCIAAGHAAFIAGYGGTQGCNGLLSSIPVPGYLEREQVEKQLFLKPAKMRKGWLTKKPKRRLGKKEAIEQCKDLLNFNSDELENFKNKIVEAIKKYLQWRKTKLNNENDTGKTIGFFRRHGFAGFKRACKLRRQIEKINYLPSALALVAHVIADSASSKSSLAIFLMVELKKFEEHEKFKKIFEVIPENLQSQGWRQRYSARRGLLESMKNFQAELITGSHEEKLIPPSPPLHN